MKQGLFSALLRLILSSRLFLILWAFVCLASVQRLPSVSKGVSCFRFRQGVSRLHGGMRRNCFPRDSDSLFAIVLFHSGLQIPQTNKPTRRIERFAHGVYKQRNKVYFPLSFVLLYRQGCFYILWAFVCLASVQRLPSVSMGVSCFRFRQGVSRLHGGVRRNCFPRDSDSLFAIVLFHNGLQIPQTNKTTRRIDRFAHGVYHLFPCRKKKSNSTTRISKKREKQVS
jgi:hypothetical protein